MSLKSFRAIVFVTLPLLATTLNLAGCQSILKTKTAETSDAHVTEGVCTIWLPVTYSSKDTPQTVLEIRANNAAQKSYCKR